MEIRDQRVTVFGMGRTAMALVRLLLREGARPFVTDSSDSPKLDPFREQLEQLHVPYECGGHTDAAVAGSALAVLSPSVPLDIAVLDAFRERNAPVTGELEFAFRYCQSPVLAVTGTNGKTTTTELLRTLVSACGYSVLLAGNNDQPFSEALLVEPVPAYYVLEVSSYQLEHAVTFRPWLGAVLNVTPDHLSRHKTIERYAAAKANMFAAQGAGDAAVVNADDAFTASMPVPPEVARWAFSLEQAVSQGLWFDGAGIRFGDNVVAHQADVPIPGRHNLANAIAALAMMRAGGFDWEQTIEGLRGFKGVEHRIEWTAAENGVDYYNDSKSTNIDSLRAALTSFTRPQVLIAGGRGKGSDYRVLCELVQARVKHMVTLGEDAPLLEEAFGGLVKTSRADSMASAVALAADAAAPGDIVLLSPGCASFDMYNNFEERGRHFKACVHAFLAGRAASAARGDQS